MIKLFSLIACLAMFACAGAQTKIEAARTKVNLATEKANCVLDIVSPYTSLLEEDVIVSALKGKDITQYLVLAGVVKSDADKLAEDLKTCKL